MAIGKWLLFYLYSFGIMLLYNI